MDMDRDRERERKRIFGKSETLTITPDVGCLFMVHRLQKCRVHDT